MNNLDIETRFGVVVSGSGYPVICIHGNGLNRNLWRHLAPDLNQDYRTIVYELRGMGKSETVSQAGAKVTVKDHVDDLGAIMDALDIEQAAIVAHAFGGFVGMQLALNKPKRVSAMILACTAAKLGGTTEQEVPHWAEPVEKQGMAPLIEKMLDRWFIKSFRDDHPQTMDLYRKMIGANPPMGYAANARGIMEYDIRDDVHKIQCPILLVTGEADFSTPIEDHQFIAQRTTNSELMIVKNASHTVPEEQPEQFNMLVLDFLGRHVSFIDQG